MGEARDTVEYFTKHRATPVILWNMTWPAQYPLENPVEMIGTYAPP